MPLLSQAQIYDAVFDDEALDSVLQSLSRAVGARSYCSTWLYRDGAASWAVDSGHWTADQIDTYMRDYAMDDVWTVAQFGQWQPGRAIDLGTLVADREFERSKVHNEFLRPIGDDVRFCLSVGSDNGSGFGAISFHRDQNSKGGFDLEIVKVLDGQAEHLARMLAMRGRFAALESKVKRRAALIDMLDLPVMLVRSDLTLIESNSAADELIQRGPFVLRRGRLSVARPQVQAALEAAVAQALDPQTPYASAIAIPRADGSHLPFSVVAAPELHGPRKAMIVGSLRTHGVRPGEDAQRLRLLYGLSPSEALLALALAAGSTPADIAESRQVALGTVRFQIKAISQKLGCSRQTDIVRIVNSLPPIRHQ